MNNILFTVISLSISGTLLALLIFLLKHALKNSVSKAFMYYIWALVLLRMIVPFGYEISTDILGTSFPSQNTQGAITDTLPVPSAPVGDVVVPSEPVINEDIIIDHEIQPELPVVTQKVSLWLRIKENLGYFWLAGAVVSIAWYAVSYAVFSRKMSRTFTPVGGKEAEVFAELTDDKAVRLVRSNKIHTPMLMGVFRPTVILPECDYKENELRGILKHELTHFLRGDIFYKWMTVIITSLHWFNPAAYFIRREINRACELSCDEAVIKYMTEEERKDYGNMLISLASQKTDRTVSVTTTLCEGKKQLKGRLMGIKSYKKKTPVAVILMIVISLLIAGCAGPVLDFGGDESFPDDSNSNVVSQEEPNSSEAPNESQDQTSSAPSDKPQSEGTLTWQGTATARQAFRDVLQGKREFYVAETQKRISIDELSEGFIYFAGEDITVDTFTLCDLDGDGASETVLWLNVGGEMYSDFVILRYNGEEVYAYNIGYRAFSDLKTDGTFSYAESAMDGGFGTMSFADEEYYINDIAYSEYDREADDGTIHYYINGKRVTEEEFEEAFIEHDKKQSAFWCDFSDENIEKVFPISNGENAVRLIVNGKDITAGQYVTVDADKQEVAVPITAILSELGCQVEWTDAKIVKVTYNGRKIVTFDLNDRDFGTPLPPGSNYCVRKVVGNEIVVDEVTAEANFLNGLGYFIRVDYSSNTVSVIQKEDSN